MIQKSVPVKYNTFVKLLAFYFMSLVLGALSLGVFGSLLRVFAFLPVLWWLLTKRTIVLSKPLLAAICFLGFSTISLFWSIDMSSTLIKNIGSISLLILLCVSSGYKYSTEDIAFLKKALVWSSRITALVVMFAGGTIESRVILTGLLVEDPNYLNAYYLFGVVNAVECILSSIKYYQQIGYLLELGLYMYLVFASGSRGGVLAIICAMFIATVGSFLRNKISLKILFFPVLLIMFTFILMLILPYILPQEVLQRFDVQSIIDSQGTGRYQLWKDYLHLFSTSPFWRQLVGYGGAVTFTLSNQALFVFVNVSHNIFVEHLVTIGIIGVGLYIIMIYQFIRAAFFRRNIFAISVLGGVLMLSMSTVFEGKVYWNILIFIICLVNLIKSVK